MSDDAPPGEQPFSSIWVLFSVVVFTAFEVVLGRFIAPLLFGAFVSPMLFTRLFMLAHLGSFFLGGIFVGVLSPKLRLHEPAVGAFVSVLIVWISGFFLPGPSWLTGASWSKLAVAGGIAFALALWGAWVGERFMGNIPGDSRRAHVRETLWGPGGALAGRRQDWLVEASTPPRKTR